MQIGKKDIEKMIGYYAKGSNPETLARTVKDLGKAKSRAVIANAMGWKDCSWEFINRCRELGATDADITEVERMCDTYELPELYKSQFDNNPKLEDASMLRAWFPKLFKVLRDHKVQNIKLEKRNPTDSEREKDLHNGRCWTLAYTVSFDYNGNHYDWKIANHTNEGGGSYGVSAQAPLNVYQDTQQRLADRAASVLDSALSESFVHGAVNKILEGVAVRDALNIKRRSVNESAGKITLEQFLDVYDCDQNGKVNVYDMTGRLFTLPFEDDETLVDPSYFKKNILRIDKIAGELDVYI